MVGLPPVLFTPLLAEGQLKSMTVNSSKATFQLNSSRSMVFSQAIMLMQFLFWGMNGGMIQLARFL